MSPRIGVNIWDGGKNVAHVYYGKFYAAPLLEDVRQACVLLLGSASLFDDQSGVRPQA